MAEKETIPMDASMVAYLEKSLLNGLKWPLDEQGQPEEAVFLLNEPNRTAFFNAKTNLLMLGIPAFEEITAEIPFTRVLFGSNLRGGAIYVPLSLREDALFLLNNPPEPVPEDENT